MERQFDSNSDLSGQSFKSLSEKYIYKKKTNRVYKYCVVGVILGDTNQYKGKTSLQP